MRKIFFIIMLVVGVFADNINTNITTIDTNITTIEGNLTLTQPQEENISINPIIGETDNIKIAILLDKDRFFQYIPSLLNSINAYMAKKDLNYDIKLFGVKDNDLNQSLQTVTQNYKYIFLYPTKPSQIQILNNYPDNYFFIPTLNKDQIPFEVQNNVYFGGIDYKKQISLLNQYISSKTYIIYDNSQISHSLTQIAQNELHQECQTKKYPIYYSQEYNNTFVYLNTKVVHTAQILSNFTYHQIKTKALLSTQINWTPLIFSLTNPEDVENLYIANSIFDINPIIEDNNLNLGSNIEYNWLDWTTSTLLNKAVNLAQGDYGPFLNDFNLYIFYNQVQYKTNLYRIFQNGFVKIVN